MKNETQKTEEKVFTATQVGVMLESIDTSIKLLAESMDVKFDGVDQKFESINQKFDLIDRKFDSIDKRFDRIDAKIDRLQDDMVEVKFELKNKVSVDQFEKLEKRVVKLEKLSPSH